MDKTAAAAPTAREAAKKLRVIAGHWPPLRADIPQLTQAEAQALVDERRELQDLLSQAFCAGEQRGWRDRVRKVLEDFS